jgi:flagellar biogenesis protein FliO
MDTGSELELLFRAVLALVVVLVLAVVSLRFGLPWLLGRPLTGGRPRRLEVEERCSLDRNHHLFLVRFDDERLLVATSPDRVLVLARGTGEAKPQPEPGGGP